MTTELAGRARRLGDDINADYIIASTRKRDTLDAALLKRYLLESVDPAFAASVQPGDILVAGRNFGCGSAMEVAATVILAAGIPAVLATSFSRTFYRNAINNGLIPVQCDTSVIAERDPLLVRLTGAELSVFNRATDRLIPAEPLPDVMWQILQSGGLVAHIRRYGAFRERGSAP